ncbi:MAG: hypothetical protein WA667_10755 [Candidatus Nitrosopolaris sp.]
MVITVGVGIAINFLINPIIFALFGLTERKYHTVKVGNDDE